MPEKTSVGADKLQFIDAYAAAGFRLTPIRTTGPKKGKAPLETNWTDTPYEPIPRHELFTDCNFGVVLDDTHLVVDLDPRNYPAGRKVWAELSDTLGLNPEDLKKTFVVQTGGGGKHIYFKKPAGVTVRHTHPAYPGIEFKTQGRQVIGAGCIHPETGKIYTPIMNTPDVIADIPDALLKFITVDTAAASLPALTVFDASKTDTPQATERFIEYLRTLTPAKRGARNNACYIAACNGKEFGVSETNAFHIISQNMQFDEPLADDEMRQAVRSAFVHSKQAAGTNNAQAVFKKIPRSERTDFKWDLDGRGKAKATLGNLCEYMRRDELGLTGLLAFNELRGVVETTRPTPWPPYKQKVWSDSDTIQLKHYISRVQKVEYTTKVVDEAVLAVAMQQPFHPVRNWLNSLKWDGQPRLDTWLHRILGVKDTPYTRAAGAITIMASVKRMFNPGCKFDYMLILEGPQGFKKSQTIEKLAGDDRHLYCSTGINLDSSSAEKDTVAIVANKMFVELAELVTNTKGEVEQVKAFLTRRYDDVRLPYQRYPESLPRQCVFIGTTNPENGAGYFRDTTGNRRFWPVECTQEADLFTLELERDQMFAEAMERVNAGEKIYMEESVEALAGDEQAERVMIDPWQDLVEQGAAKDRVWLTEEIYRIVLKCDPKYFGTREQRRIAAVMRACGFKYERYFHAKSGTRRRAFKHPSYNIADEHDKVLEKEEKILDNDKD